MPQGQVSIQILGQTFTFQVQGDMDMDRVRQAADLLAERVDKARQGLGGSSSMSGKLSAVVLAAMDIAHLYIEAKEGHQGFLDKIGSRSERLLKRMNSKPLDPGAPGQRHTPD